MLRLMITMLLKLAGNGPDGRRSTKKGNSKQCVRQTHTAMLDVAREMQSMCVKIVDVFEK
jgi:hypothetical protein